MTVRAVKRRTSNAPPPDSEVEAPAARKPEGRPVEAGVPRAAAPEARKSDGDQRGASGASPLAVLRGQQLTITIPSSSFAPVKYGSFQLPSVSATIAIGPGDDPEAIKDSLLQELRRIQEEAFTEELAIYLRRTKAAFTAAAEAFGE